MNWIHSIPRRGGLERTGMRRMQAAAEDAVGKWKFVLAAGPSTVEVGVKEPLNKSML